MATHSFTLPRSAYTTTSGVFTLAGWYLPDDAAYDLPVNVIGPNSAKVRLQSIAIDRSSNPTSLELRLRSGSWVSLTDQNRDSYEVVLTATLSGTQYVGRFLRNLNLSGLTSRWFLPVSSPATARATALALLGEMSDGEIPTAANVSFNFDPNPPAPPTGADNLYIGSQKVDKVYLGDNEVDAMYLGSTRIF